MQRIFNLINCDHSELSVFEIIFFSFCPHANIYYYNGDK